MPDGIETGNVEEVAGDAGQQDTGNKGDASDGQKAAPQDAAGNQNEVNGLKAAATAERVKRQEAEAVTAQLQQQMQILQANGTQGHPAQAPQQPTSMFMQIAKQLGYDPEYLTPVETGNVMDTMMQFMSQNQQNSAFDASHSDFNEVVGKVVNGIFQESVHLQKVFDTNPSLRQAFSGLGLTPHSKLIAYEMVKNSPGYQATLAEASMTDEQKKSLEAEAAIKAANSTASISSVQGGGNLDRQAQLVGMSDVEFRQELDKKMGEAT